MPKLTEYEMKKILQNELPVELIKLDGGIVEFHEYENMSIGISYESIEGDAYHAGYIVNLFVNGEYVNIPGSYNDICDTAKALADEWNRWTKD